MSTSNAEMATIPPNLPADSIELDLSDINLDMLSKLEGTALESIIRDLDKEQSEQEHSRHSSHSSHSTHGTAAW